MISLRNRLGQLAMAIAVVAAFLLVGLVGPGALAAPIKDTRAMGAKVLGLKENCEETGGTFSDRPSATDSDTHLTKCSGGGLGTAGCVLTSTTSECFPLRVKPTDSIDDVWGLIDSLGLDAATTSDPVGAGPAQPDGQQSISTAVDDKVPGASSDKKHNKHKKHGKGGKGRR